MITETIGKYTVRRFDDINELVVKNYNLFNEFGLYDAEVGSDMTAIGRHFNKIDHFFLSKKWDDAVQARKNLHQAFYHIFQHNNFPALQWMASIHSIDGVQLLDHAIENLKDWIQKLSDEGLTQGKVVKDVQDLKKKYVNN